MGDDLLQTRSVQGETRLRGTTGCVEEIGCRGIEELLRLLQHCAPITSSYTMTPGAFIDDPVRTRFRARLKLRIPETLAAYKFAHVVFVCEGLLQERTWGFGSRRCRNNPRWVTGHFFRIATARPIDMQMVLCLRAHGSQADVISRWDMEAAFRCLAEDTLCYANEFQPGLFSPYSRKKRCYPWQ